MSRPVPRWRNGVRDDGGAVPVPVPVPVPALVPGRGVEECSENRGVAWNCWPLDWKAGFGVSLRGGWDRFGTRKRCGVGV